MQRVGLVFGFGLLVLLACLFLLLRDRAAGAVATAVNVPTESSVGKEGKYQGAEGLKKVAARNDARDSVAQEGTDVLRGRVLSDAGRPIPDAVVAWIALQQEDTEANPCWPIPGWGVSLRPAVNTTADANGAFSFEREPAGGLTFGSVLISLHPSHYAGGLDLGVDLNKWKTGAEIILEQTTPIHVNVVGPSGAAVPGATVYHVTIPRDLVGPESAPLSIHERFFAHEMVSDANGRAEIAPFAGEQAFWATYGDLVSIPWQGPRPSTVTLVLGSSFTVGGTIAFPDRSDWEPGYEGERRIIVSGQSGNLPRPLACLRGVQSGEWGPLRIPLHGDRYLVRLEGAPISPLEFAIERPIASSHHHVDLVAKQENGIYLFVENEQGKPLTNARAMARWNDPDSGKPCRLDGASRPDGYLYLGTFPAGGVRIEVSAPGYGTVEAEVDVPSEEGFRIVLARGGSISGHCMSDGIPVADFELIYWREGNPRVPRSKTVLGHSDGSFVLQGLVPGDWSIHAATPSNPCGKPLVVKVRAEEESHVEIGLVLPIRGGGRVLDAETGNALPDAKVQVFSSGGMERNFPWGPAVRASSDGTFDVDAFVLGSNFIRVSADGYADADVKAIATDREFLDWGEIRLSRPQALQIALLGLDELESEKRAGLYAHTTEGHILPTRHFDEAGQVGFEGVPPGDYRVLVSSPGGYSARLQFKLDSGRQWNIDHKVAGDKKLTVRVVNAKGDPTPNASTTISAEEPMAHVLRGGFTSQDGTITFQGIRADRVSVWCADQNGVILGSKDLSFGADSSLTTEIRFGERPFRIRVVDPDGQPIAGAWTTVLALNGIDIYGVESTDVDGWASILGLPKADLLLHVHHGIAGWQLGTPFSAVGEEFVLVLNATGFVEFELKDGAEPLADVSTRIETMAGVTISQVRQTDSHGVVRFDTLGPGNYHFACRRADCWTVLVDRQLGVDEKAHLLVQMRRLADLDLSVQNSEGVPVSGATLELTSVEFGVSVASWILAEQVQAPNGLTTNVHGAVLVEGLPRGQYMWSLSAAGESLTGSFELAPGVINKVPIQLPR